MKFSFELKNYWKPGIFILGFSFFILYIEPNGSMNVILLGLSSLMSISIYKHYEEKGMIPTVTVPALSSSKPNHVKQKRETTKVKQKKHVTTPTTTTTNTTTTTTESE